VAPQACLHESRRGRKIAVTIAMATSNPNRNRCRSRISDFLEITCCGYESSESNVRNLLSTWEMRRQETMRLWH
jgi:hypothetical protein